VVEKCIFGPKKFEFFLTKIKSSYVKYSPQRPCMNSYHDLYMHRYTVQFVDFKITHLNKSLTKELTLYKYQSLRANGLLCFKIKVITMLERLSTASCMQTF
jgi:hypothetical protein